LIIADVISFQVNWLSLGKGKLGGMCGVPVTVLVWCSCDSSGLVSALKQLVTVGFYGWAV